MLSILINAVLIISALPCMHIHTSASYQKVISNFINRSNKAYEVTQMQHYQDVHSKSFKFSCGACVVPTSMLKTTTGTILLF